MNSNETKAILKITAASIFLLAIAVFEEFADPFGFISSSNTISSTSFSAMISPFYGKKEKGKISGQEEILVVLYDDSYLDDRQYKWPLNVRKHRQIIERLAAAGAETVFLDVYLNASSDRKERQIANFISDIQEIEADYGTSVWLSGLKHNPALEYKGIKHDRMALVEMSVEPHQYALTQKAGDQRYPTAAYALYQEWCKRNEQYCHDNLENLNKETMFIQWGYAPGKKLSNYYKDQGIICQQPAETSVKKIWASLRLLFKKLSNNLSDSGEEKCPYTNVVSAHILESLNTDDLRKITDGKTILIGTDIKLLSDTKRSTVHGHLPGVFWHAAALDNLIEYGNRFLRIEHSKSTPSLSLITIITVSVAYALFSMAIILRNGADSLEKSESLYLKLGFLTILSIGLTWGIIIHFYRLAPESWLSTIIALSLINSKPYEAIFSICYRSRPTQGIIKQFLNGTFIFALLITLAYIATFSFISVSIIKPDASIKSIAPAALIYGILIIALVSSIYSDYKSHKTTRPDREETH